MPPVALGELLPLPLPGAAPGNTDALSNATSSITLLLRLIREEAERDTERREINPPGKICFQLALPLASCTAVDLVMEGG